MSDTMTDDNGHAKECIDVLATHLLQEQHEVCSGNPAYTGM